MRSKCYYSRYAVYLSVLWLSSSFAAPVPPSVLYHFGKKEHLVADAMAHIVPIEVWDRFIMGDETSYNLNPFRRGLYGTVHPRYAETFGEWFMAIHLDEECLKPEAVAIASDLPQSEVFQSWFKLHAPIEGFKNMESFISECYAVSDGSSGLPIRQVSSLANLEGAEGPCEKLVNSYFEQNNVRVVLDERWLDQEYVERNIDQHVSWYIRDRSCIKDVKGTASDAPALLASIADFWKSPSPTDAMMIPVRGAGVLMLLASMAEKSPIDSQIRSTLKESIKVSDIFWKTSGGKKSPSKRISPLF